DEDRGTVQESKRNQNSLRLAHADLPRPSLQESRVVDGQLHLVQELAETQVERRAPGRLMRAPRLLKMRAQGYGAVERGHGALRNESDLLSAHLPGLGRAHGEQIAFFEED